MSHAKQGKLDAFVKATETKSLDNILSDGGNGGEELTPSTELISSCLKSSSNFSAESNAEIAG